jgi:hypothetical protein
METVMAIGCWTARLDLSPSGFYFSAEISEISPKTGFTGDHRYFLVPNEIFRFS